MGAIETISYEPTVWCTPITEDWIVNNLDLKIISASEENGGIRIMKDDQRPITSFWYEEIKRILKSQLIDQAFRGGMSLTKFVYQVAEQGVILTQEN